MNTSYSDLENPTPLAWKYVSGSSIAPTKPDGFNLEPTPSGALKVSIIGAAYAGELGSLELPLPPNHGLFSLSYILTPDDVSETEAQAFEVDLIASLAGWHYNGSTQWNLAKGGMFQIVDKNGNWVDTGIALGAFVAWKPVPLTIDFLVDFVNRNISVVSVTLPGKTPSAIPAALQNVPATNMGWADGLTVQVQGDRAGDAAGAFSYELAEIEVTAA